MRIKWLWRISSIEFAYVYLCHVLNCIPVSLMFKCKTAKFESHVRVIVDYAGD